MDNLLILFKSVQQATNSILLLIGALITTAVTGVQGGVEAIPSHNEQTAIVSENSPAKSEKDANASNAESRSNSWSDRSNGAVSDRAFNDYQGETSVPKTAPVAKDKPIHKPLETAVTATAPVVDDTITPTWSVPKTAPVSKDKPESVTLEVSAPTTAPVVDDTVTPTWSVPKTAPVAEDKLEGIVPEISEPTTDTEVKDEDSNANNSADNKGVNSVTTTTPVVDDTVTPTWSVPTTAPIAKDKPESVALEVSVPKTAPVVDDTVTPTWSVPTTAPVAKDKPNHKPLETAVPTTAPVVDDTATPTWSVPKTAPVVDDTLNPTWSVPTKAPVAKDKPVHAPLVKAVPTTAPSVNDEKPFADMWEIPALQPEKYRKYSEPKGYEKYTDFWSPYSTILSQGDMVITPDRHYCTVGYLDQYYHVAYIPKHCAKEGTMLVNKDHKNIGMVRYFKKLRNSKKIADDVAYISLNLAVYTNNQNIYSGDKVYFKPKKEEYINSFGQRTGETHGTLTDDSLMGTYVSSNSSKNGDSGGPSWNSKGFLGITKGSISTGGRVIVPLPLDAIDAEFNHR